VKTTCGARRTNKAVKVTRGRTRNIVNAISSHGMGRVVEDMIIFGYLRLIGKLKILFDIFDFLIDF
jgi:hypothetical protein